MHRENHTKMNVSSTMITHYTNYSSIDYYDKYTLEQNLTNNYFLKRYLDLLNKLWIHVKIMAYFVPIMVAYFS